MDYFDKKIKIISIEYKKNKVVIYIKSTCLPILYFYLKFKTFLKIDACSLLICKIFDVVFPILYEKWEKIKHSNKTPLRLKFQQYDVN